MKKDDPKRPIAQSVSRNFEKNDFKNVQESKQKPVSIDRRAALGALLPLAGKKMSEGLRKLSLSLGVKKEK